jgi:phenylacetate-coenzyme A ligase PaaK-like adenylate-forming protein
MTTTTGKQTSWQRLRVDLQTALLAGIPEHVQRLAWSAEQLQAAQRDGLRRLLSHAVEHAPFHHRRLAGIDVGRLEPGDLSSLPVMTKADMMAALDEVFTDRRLTRDLAEQALAATGTQPVPILDDYLALATGGSSGQRGVVVFDRAAVVGYALSLARPLLARLRALGGPPPGGLPVAMVAAASAVHATGLGPAFAGPDMPFRFLPVPVTLPLPKIVERLNALQAPVVYGYPSMLARLAVEQRAGRLHIAPMAVTATGETLLPETRAAITEAFRAPVVDNFGSTEGLVGSSAPGDSVLVFNTDMCIVELVDTDNRPVPPGVPSAKALVTNLYNLAQPLIRYELTDTFVRQPDVPDHGHLRAHVHGRADEILHYQGLDVHPHVVRSVLVKSPQILDYQVRQTPHGIKVDAIAADAADTQALSGRVAEALARAGLSQPQVSIRIVDDLQRHQQTGKLRRFIPLPPDNSQPDPAAGSSKRPPVLQP